MPAGPVESDYANAKIYRLVATGTLDVYIGSTCGNLNQRLWHHNYSASNEKQRKTSSCKLYEDGRTVAIELVENFPCANNEELKLRERYWIENTPNCINTNVPGRTWKERWAANPTYAERHKEYMKEPAQVQKRKELRATDEWKAKEKARRAEEYTCECGAVVTVHSKGKHLKSKKHLDLMTSNIIVH